MGMESEAGGMRGGVRPSRMLPTIKRALITNKTLFMQILGLSPLGHIPKHLYANIMFLDIIQRPVYISKHNVPEIGTSSIVWAQLSRFYLKTEKESSLGNVVLKYKEDGVFR
jgi:hypothetical protein